MLHKIVLVIAIASLVDEGVCVIHSLNQKYASSALRWTQQDAYNYKQQCSSLVSIVRLDDGFPAKDDCLVASVNKDFILHLNEKSAYLHLADNHRISLPQWSGRARRDVSNSSPLLSTQAPHTGNSHNTSQSQNINEIRDEPEVKVQKFVFNESQHLNQAFIHRISNGQIEHVIVLMNQQNYSQGFRETVKSKLWLSNDGGATFVEKTLDPIANFSFLYTFNGDKKKLLFTDVAARKVYTSQDVLESWEISTTPVEPDVILPHPTDYSKILLYSFYQRQLYVSTDFAKNWSLVSADVLPNFYWGTSGTDTDVGLVFMEVETETPSQAKLKVCMVPDCKEVTFDQPGPFLANSLIVHGEYAFVQKSSTAFSNSFLMVSFNRSKFQRAHFPGDVNTDDFLLLNLDNGQVFVAVNHGDHVNLYQSDMTGQFYVLSFANIYHIMRLAFFEIDFYEVSGLNWTYIVNAKDASGLRTYISYNKGGNWQPLTLNKSCNVPEECALLLEMKQSVVITSILSDEHAPGLILAHGYVGTKVRSLEPTVFVSNDGGATWVKAVQADGAPLTGRYRFQILDQGGLLTAVPDSLLTMTSSRAIYYSWDDGQHWMIQQFHPEGLQIKTVLAEAGGLSLVQSIFGRENMQRPWSIIKIDFSKVLGVKCEEKDLVTWSVRDYNSLQPNNNCILGRMVQVRHRKTGTRCHYGEVIGMRTESNVSCDCTSEDFECDFGFEETQGKCKPAGWFDETYPFPECDSGATYHRSPGYRKVPGDVCIETADDRKKYVHVETNCSIAAPSNLSIHVGNKKISSGKKITFHLEQFGGSKFKTKFAWNFGDGSQMQEETWSENATEVTHIFKSAGHFNVTVVAENSRGKANVSIQIHVQEPLAEVLTLAPLALKTGLPVRFMVIPISTTQVLDTTSDHVHFAWTFGDESAGDLPVLCWNNSVTHVYRQAGVYRWSVEVVNSVSSIYTEQSIQMFDDAEVLQLSFSNNVDKYTASSPVLLEMFTVRLRQQLAEDLGMSRLRLAAVGEKSLPTTVQLFIFPSSIPGERTAKSIRDQLISQVLTGSLGVNLFGNLHEAGEIISITSATSYPPPGHRPGTNMKAVYVAVPVLVAVLVASVFVFVYFKKKNQHSLQPYGILHVQDDSDDLLDDDDAPLDLNVEFGAPENSRDDEILGIGTSPMVVVTGTSSNSAEIC